MKNERESEREGGGREDKREEMRVEKREGERVEEGEDEALSTSVLQAPTNCLGSRD